MTTPYHFVIKGRPAGSFQTLAEVSEHWVKLRDEKGWRSSTAPLNSIHQGGDQIGHVSYNGRVWPGRPQDWHSDVKPLYDNRRGA